MLDLIRLFGLLGLILIAFALGVRVGPTIAIPAFLKPYFPSSSVASEKSMNPGPSASSSDKRVSLPRVVALVELLTSFRPDADGEAKSLYELCIAQQAGQALPKDCEVFQGDPPAN
jgi:hypothetical protein